MSVVTLVNCFVIPKGREEEFFALWQLCARRKDSWSTSFIVLLRPMLTSDSST